MSELAQEGALGGQRGWQTYLGRRQSVWAWTYVSGRESILQVGTAKPMSCLCSTAHGSSSAPSKAHFLPFSHPPYHVNSSKVHASFGLPPGPEEGGGVFPQAFQVILPCTTVWGPPL